MKILKFLTLGAFTIFTYSAFSGVEVYVGPSSEVLYVQEASKLGNNAFLVKFTGVESAWADKVFKTINNQSIGGRRLSINYVLDLSSGKQNRTYGVLSDSGTTLINGSLVKKVELQIPERGETIKLHYSAEKSQNTIDLNEEFSKKPFSPEP